MRKTRASNYRRRIRIEKNTTMRGTTGEAEKTWSLYVTRRASIEPLQGRELFAAQQFQTKSTHKIKIRFDRDLNLIADVNGLDYQIIYNSKTYSIDSAFNVFEADKEIHFMCYTKSE